MMRRNQNGSALPIVLAVIVIVAIGVVGYLVYQSKSSEDQNNSKNQSDETYFKTLHNPKVASGDDQELKAYLEKILGGISEYQSDNNGSLPTNLATVRTNLKLEDYANWKNAGAIITGEPVASTVYYGADYVCDDTTNLMKQGQRRDVALVVLLPTSKTAFCLS